MRTKELLEKRGAIVAEMRALHDAGDMSAEQFAKYEALDVSQGLLKAQIEVIERSATIEAEMQAGNALIAAGRHVSTDQVADEKANEDRIFGIYLRQGLSALAPVDHALAMSKFQAAQSIGSGSGGGLTIPQGFYDVLTDAQLAYGGMIEIANVIDTSTGNPLPMPTDNDTSNTGAILTENTQAGLQDVTFGAVTLNAYTYTSKIVLVSNQLLQDSAFNLDAFLAKRLGERLARIINTHMTVGTGTGQPNGAVTASTLGNTAAVGAVATGLIFDDLLNLEHSVDPAYRNGAVFMMHDSTLKVLKKIKDNQGRPLFLPGFAMKEPDTINGIPFKINQDMPVLSANAKVVLYGDFKTYMIRRVAGTQVMRLTERYADFNQTAFVAFQRWDGNLLDAGTHPLKYAQMAAS